MGTQLVNTPTISAVDVAEFVEPRHHQDGKRGNGGREELVIGAQILDQLQLQAEDGAVAFGGDFVVIHVAAAVNGALEILAAGFDPLHGLADLHGHEAHERFFGVDVELAAEAAADLGRDHAQAVLVHAEHLRDQRAQQVRNLSGGVEREILFGGAIIGHHAARFHGGGDQALAGDALLDDDFGFGEGLLGIAAFLVVSEGDVVGPLGMDGGRAGGERFFGIGDGGERFVIHFDQVERVGGDVAVGGDDDGDRVADEIDAVLGQNGMCAARAGRAARRRKAPVRRLRRPCR